MEALLFLAGLIFLLTPLVVIWLIASHIGLKRSVAALQDEIAGLRARQASGSADTERQPTARSPWTARQAGERTKHADTPPPRPTSPPPLPPAEPATPPRAFVFDAANFRRLIAWLRDNWVIAVAAVSLVMAGIFLVQYGIEHGVLSPRNRVLAALGFGAAMIGAGEWIRRRIGDGPDGAAAFLPSTFAGAGIVTLFAAIVSAQQLYGFIGQEAAFFWLVLVAALSVVLGWLYGPMLSVVGLGGAVLTPFIVSTGTSEHIEWLFYYFALIAAVGLWVDALKRSAWVSALALVLPYFGAALVWVGSGSEHFIVFAGIVAVLAICVPSVALRPAFSGAMSHRAIEAFGNGERWPEFPTRLAAAAILALSTVATLASTGAETGFWLGLGSLFTMLAILAFWLDRTPVLDDLAVPVALGMLSIVGLHGWLDLPAAQALLPHPTPVEPVPGVSPEAPRRTLTWLVGFGCAVSAMAGWRSQRNPDHALFWAAGAAAFAPAIVGLIALFWQPLRIMSDIEFSAHAIGVAVLMTLFAEQALRRDGEARLRASLYALAALNMIALALSIVLTETALTLALAFVTASAAWLDRRFDVRPVTLFVQLGAIACGYRLVIDPGLIWALDASFREMSVGFLGTIAALAAAWVLLRQRQRTTALVIVESSVASLFGIFLCLALFRGLDDGNPFSHGALSLYGMVWLLSAGAQLHRATAGGRLRIVRLGFAGLFGVLGALFVATAAILANPLLVDRVSGPPVLDSLLVAYGLPALLLGAAAWKGTRLPIWLRRALGAASTALAALYVGLEIRRFWQGPVLTHPGVQDGELYSYTIAMLVVGSGLLGLALQRRSAALRLAGMSVVALTVAKVFLIDMSGLEGLIRVLSFLALGLVLAGLAMLNRWIAQALAKA